MSKRRTKRASDRHAKRQARKATDMKSSGKSDYGEKRARSSRGRFSPGSPFYLSPARQAEAVATWEATGSLPGWARWA